MPLLKSSYAKAPKRVNADVSYIKIYWNGTRESGDFPPFTNRPVATNTNGRGIKPDAKHLNSIRICKPAGGANKNSSV